MTQLRDTLWTALAVLLGVLAALPAHGAEPTAELAPTLAPVEVNEHGYPVNVRWGIWAAPSGAGNNREGGTLGYSITSWHDKDGVERGFKGWGDGYITPILTPVIEAGREPDFVLCGSPGPYWRGLMCWQSPLHCARPRAGLPLAGPPPWAEEWAGEPIPSLQVVLHSWGEWRRRIPASIEVGMYGGRLNNPELIELCDRDPAAAVAACDWVMDFYTRECGFDFVAVDASGPIGGRHDKGEQGQTIPAWEWLQRDDNPLALWFAEQTQRTDVRVYAEAWPQSGDLGANTRNRLLGPLSPTGKGAPCMVLWKSRNNTPLYNEKPNQAPATHHDCMVLGSYFPATPDQCVDAVGRGVKEIALEPGVWRRVAHLLPQGE